MEFDVQLKESIKEVENILEEFLPKGKDIPKIIIEAMEYSLMNGGKRLRPILLIEAAKCVEGDKNKVLPLACAIEMIHTYSLIHDDLPAMDDDDYRRGKLTNHKVFGEGMSVLAGDALLNYAFEIMLTHIPENYKEMMNYLKAVKEIAYAAGIQGMIGGQVKDLEYKEGVMDLETLQYIHIHKTGALIKASLRAGAIASGATKEQLKVLTVFGEKIGLAFQIVDDILDVIGDQKKLGKAIGSDQKNHKITYPSVYGLEKSQQMIEKLLQEALNHLKLFGSKGQFLGELGKFICKREY
ncbi:polyprenyl synthetase family protein [Garciella nitratireducens]|uniref:Farnesyl diphosphate synthase n=1 Tax=Garciella nitratireducens DSM 15102 TaxID=1121911 RepID=A0A1T4K3V2_9FIRM|nr:farnesyl diphosphate synthase [Garciella nitratireducens]SJZ37005.1 geranylgeranyl diphosphate synthase, type II [Garciella nitratireducens DSM 15102]